MASRAPLSSTVTATRTIGAAPDGEPVAGGVCGGAGEVGESLQRTGSKLSNSTAATGNRLVIRPPGVDVPIYLARSAPTQPLTVSAAQTP